MTRYANLIEATFTWNFFLTIGIGMILINIIGIQVIVERNDEQSSEMTDEFMNFLEIQILMGTNEPESTVRFIAFAVALQMVFTVNCKIAQVLMDHSDSIRFYM